MSEELLAFLPCETPSAWVDAALADLDTLLIDHANCEKKAAATAMHLLYRHVDKSDLLVTMARLAREELLHFQQVVNLLDERGVVYRRLSPSRYAAGLREHIRHEEQGGLLDILLIGALVEARSCERFARLVPALDDGLARFYKGLVRSESRHFRDYLELARRYGGDRVESRLGFLRDVERELVLSTDSELRFHSGVPQPGQGGSAQRKPRVISRQPTHP